MIKKFLVWLVVLCVLFVFSACARQSDTLPTQNVPLNLVEALALGDAVRVELLAFDLEDVDPSADYIPVINISDVGEVEEIIFLLGGDLEETPALLCIPEYLLRFWLADGDQVDLGFSCQGAHFLTGNQAVFEGRQFAPPEKFTRLIEFYLEQPVESPESINLLKAAGFGNVVKIEIFGQNSEEGSPERSSILLIEDVEVIEEILLGLSGEYDFVPRDPCTVDYFLLFTMDDDRTAAFGFGCGGDRRNVLRGDQDFFFGQDILVLGDFPTLFEDLVNP